ncbi:unnamed protein product [Ilex paraguariensis]|uniref:Uncharacterized protein n=1 Tax=Ilex paraguariensis TaxID=185542 RepID=A0ABC8UY00_9AQUA
MNVLNSLDATPCQRKRVGRRWQHKKCPRSRGWSRKSLPPCLSLWWSKHAILDPFGGWESGALKEQLGVGYGSEEE